MELWPSYSPLAATKKNQTKSVKGKSKSKQSWSCYPIVDHGTQSAATLVNNGDELDWINVHSARKGVLVPQGKQTKVFPCTRPREIKNVHASLRKRAEHGAKFLRRYHPDVDVPFELIEDALKYDDKAQKQRDAFDPVAGNTLSATYCFDGIKKKAIALVFPSGELGCELNISPMTVRSNSVLFQPRSQSAWIFDTPIRQIVSSAPAVYMEEKPRCSLAVRTFGQVSIFDVRNQSTFMADSTKPPFAISEIMGVRPQDLHNSSDGMIADMNFSRSEPRELFVITERGVGYQCSCADGQQIVKNIFDTPPKGGGGFWRILGDRNTYGGTVASERLVHKFDTRNSDRLINVFEYDDERNVITSICPTQIEYLLCVSTTSQVIWIDDRYTKQPLLGWKHHRAFDRALSLQTIEFENTSLTFLGSSKNNHITSISVHKLQDGPLQCQMLPRALPPSTHNAQITGRTLLRHPGAPSNSFSLVELSSQGSLYEREFRYVMDASTISLEQEGRFDCTWSDDVQELKRREEDLAPEYGTLAEKEMMKVDLSGLYEALFGIEAQEARVEVEETSAEEVYEILENMPTYWQRADTGEEHMHTLFDVAFGSGEDPIHEERADFLTGTVLSSARGYRAREQNRLPIDEVVKKAGWYADIQPILHRICPDVFKDRAKEGQHEEGNNSAGKSTSADMIEAPYTVGREEENPEADRLDTEAREELLLDLVLASHVVSAMPIKDPTAPPSIAQGRGGEGREDAEEVEDTSFLTQETEKLSLSGWEIGKGRMKEPPQVAFGFLRPIDKGEDESERRRRKREKKQDSGSETGAEDQTQTQPTATQKGKDNDNHRERLNASSSLSSSSEDPSLKDKDNTPTLPLGVRLLLSEWRIGEDPLSYEYVDPYDLDSSATAFDRQKSQSQNQKSQSQVGGRGQMKGTQKQTPTQGVEDEFEMGGMTQSQVPPPIIASRTLKERETQTRTHTHIHAHAPTQPQMHSLSRTELEEGGDSQSQSQQPRRVDMVNTQIEPGQFGGRPLSAGTKKAKPVKRIGGF